ncbi:uncharacterized protein LOC130719117 [Lotus japonicus]|uniref:uncharacterized protein LOC130719117 n=1 Tax=Lotus japonicus TaxID=34305 RepID=UPI00258E97F7|nr:uncharacterized protein LOC130719117 [Lotus japonicus]
MSATPAKKLMNDPPDVVNEYIEGLVETNPGLHYVEGFPQVKVVFRADIPCGQRTYDKVAVISGGYCDNEPAHAGFVGEGMLTAAICGDVFSSPPVNSILAGIRAVTGKKGCLLIVKNYTGDRLNFGLAAEKARTEGFDVETVCVEDDGALPPSRGIARRIGLEGAVLVQKVAGAAAAAGLSLADVTAEAKHASEVVETIGVALHPCKLPVLALADRLGPGKMEYGLGIHGEPGASVTDIQPVDEVVSHVLKKILSKETNYVLITPGSRVVLMINGLGATPLMELMVAEGKAAVLKFLVEHGMAVDRVYTRSSMTSRNIQGFSISMMRADPSILQRLEAETKAPYWPVAVEGNQLPTKLPVPVPPSRSAKSSEAGCATYVPAECGQSSVPNPGSLDIQWHSAVNQSVDWKFTLLTIVRKYIVTSPKMVKCVFKYILAYSLIVAAVFILISKYRSFNSVKILPTVLALSWTAEKHNSSIPSPTIMPWVVLAAVFILLAFMVRSSGAKHSKHQDEWELGAEIDKSHQRNTIFEGRYHGREMAVKVLPYANFELAQKEMSTLKKVDWHPNVLRFYTEKVGSTAHMIGLERCGCSLKQLLGYYKYGNNPGNSQCKEFLSNLKKDMKVLWIQDSVPCTQFMAILRNIAEGIYALHSANIVHGNMNTRHVLVTKEGRSITAKLCDFGKSQEMVGDDLIKGKSRDMYNIGRIFYECVHGISIDEKLKYVVTPRMFDHPETTLLLNALLSNVPSMRPTALQVINHPFFWDEEKKIMFLNETSNRLFREHFNSFSVTELEKCSHKVFKTNWDKLIDESLLHTGHDGTSLRSLLRCFRNAYQHYDKSSELKVGKLHKEFFEYFGNKFPQLFMEVYGVALKQFSSEMQFISYF